MNRHSQDGVTLVVSLFILLLMTAIGLAAAKLSTANERMAMNNQLNNVAFQAAESGIQTWINNYQAKSEPFSGVGTIAGGGSGVVPKYDVRSLPRVCTDQPSSLNAADDSGTPQMICFDITSNGKACTGDDCDVSANDGNARALHVQGYRARINL